MPRAKLLRARTPSRVVREKELGDWPLKSVEYETKGCDARDGGAQGAELHTTVRGDTAEAGAAGRRWAQMASAAGAFAGEAADTPQACVTDPPPHCAEQPAASLTQSNEHDTVTPGARGDAETVGDGVGVVERVGEGEGLWDGEDVALAAAVADVDTELDADAVSEALADEVREADADAARVADLDDVGLRERVAVAVAAAEAVREPGAAAEPEAVEVCDAVHV